MNIINSVFDSGAASRSCNHFGCERRRRPPLCRRTNQFFEMHWARADVIVQTKKPKDRKETKTEPA